MVRKYSPPRPGFPRHPSEHHFLFSDRLAATEVLGASHGVERELLNQFIPGVANPVMCDLGSDVQDLK